MGLVGGATKLDVSKPTLAVAVVATTVVSATPGLSDALAGSDASWAPTATKFTPLPGLSVETLGVSSTSGLGGITDGSEASWDPTTPKPSLKPKCSVSGTTGSATESDASAAKSLTSALTTSTTVEPCPASRCAALCNWSAASGTDSAEGGPSSC